ncbi:hypothetical protein AYX15_06347, partial [Cryptococcus neoformans]
IGWWGDMGGPKQRGVKTYGLSPYRQRPLAGMLRAYVFNGSRRTMQQLPYVAPPLMFFYGVYYWAKTKYDYYNSKQGHFDHLIEEGVIKPGQYERPTVGPVVH